MLQQLNCLFCSKVFYTQYKNSKFCSLSCSTSNKNKKLNDVKYKVYNEHVSKCLKCNEPLSFRKRKNKFCSKSCAATYNNVLKLRKVKTKQCGQCGQLTTNPKYCSNKCSIDSKRKPIEEKRALNRENYRRYIAKRKYQTPIDENLEEIKKFYLRCPKGYEVDHIIPISKGGKHSLDNLQYLTRTENRKKSNKILADK